MRSRVPAPQHPRLDLTVRVATRLPVGNRRAFPCMACGSEVEPECVYCNRCKLQAAKLEILAIYSQLLLGAQRRRDDVFWPASSFSVGLVTPGAGSKAPAA